LLDAQRVYTARVITPGRLEGNRHSPSLEWPTEKVLKEFKRLARHEHGLLWVDLPGLAPPWAVPADYLGAYFPEEAEGGQAPLTAWTDPPAGPLDPADAALERLQYTYAAAMTYYDDQLGVLLEELRECDCYEDLLLIFTADRGLVLGEHGMVGEHRPWLHD